MNMAVNETYSTDWESPSETGGQWKRLVDHGTYSEAEAAAKAQWNQLRHHARIVCHREGQEDVTLDERGPFSGPSRAADRA
jgi:hypothetical protein